MQEFKLGGYKDCKDCKFCYEVDSTVSSLKFCYRFNGSPCQTIRNLDSYCGYLGRFWENKNDFK